MAKSLPYYPLYVDDFDEDPNVLAMNLAEVGLYQLALNEAWKRGSIPADPEDLAIIIRRRPADVKKAWPKVQPCWVPNCAPGRLVNPRQEREREKASKLSSSRSEAARASHAPESLRNPANAGSLQEVLQVDLQDRLQTYESVSESFSNSNLEGGAGETEPLSPETIIRFWNNARGLKHLTPKERIYVKESKPVFMSEEMLEEALRRFAQWYKTATQHLRSPVAVFLKDPQSWGTLHTVAKAGAQRWMPRLVQFRALYQSTGAPDTDYDWDDAMPFCEPLVDDDWDRADAHVVTVQGAYMKSPKNYFRTREFERAPRPAPKSRAEEMWDRI